MCLRPFVASKTRMEASGAKLVQQVARHQRAFPFLSAFKFRAVLCVCQRRVPGSLGICLPGCHSWFGILGIRLWRRSGEIRRDGRDTLFPLPGGRTRAYAGGSEGISEGDPDLTTTGVGRIERAILTRARPFELRKQGAGPNQVPGRNN